MVKSVEVLQGSIEIKCDDQLKEDAQKEYLALFSAKPQVEGVVKGLRLLGSEEEIQILNKMLRDNPVEEWQKTQSCNTVLCALTKMYDSLEAAHRVLNIAARDGYIVSAAREFKIEGKDQGQLFFPDFKDPNACTDLEVIDYDPTTARTTEFKVMFKGNSFPCRRYKKLISPIKEFQRSIKS